MAINFTAEYIVLRDTAEQLKGISEDIDRENAGKLCGYLASERVKEDCRTRALNNITKRLLLVADSIDNQGERK